MDDKGYKNYMEEQENHGETKHEGNHTGEFKYTPKQTGELGTLLRTLFMLVMTVLFVFGLFILAGKVGVKVLGEVQETVTEMGDVVNQQVIAKFDRGNLTEYEVTGKSFGEKSNRARSWRVNYLSIKTGGETLDISVPRELYDNHEVGDNMKFYIDNTNEYAQLMHESEVLVSIVE